MSKDTTDTTLEGLVAYLARSARDGRYYDVLCIMRTVLEQIQRQGDSVPVATRRTFYRAIVIAAWRTGNHTLYKEFRSRKALLPR